MRLSLATIVVWVSTITLATTTPAAAQIEPDRASTEAVQALTNAAKDYESAITKALESKSTLERVQANSETLKRGWQPGDPAYAAAEKAQYQASAWSTAADTEQKKAMAAF